MFFIIGLVVVVGAVLAGYIMEGGKIKVLLEPLPAEGTILLGAAIGAVPGGQHHEHHQVGGGATSPSRSRAADTPRRCTWSRSCSSTEVYVNIKKGGLLALEQDVNDPHSSTIFKKYADHAGATTTPWTSSAIPSSC